MNATHLYEKVRGDRSLPPLSESFWTAIFAFFLLHLSKAHPEPTVTAWRVIDSSARPWYERKLASAGLRLKGLSFSAIAVEPLTVMLVWPAAKLDIKLTGIAPDIVLRLEEEMGKTRYALVENKVTTGAMLNANQLSTYPALSHSLAAQGIECQFFVLHSVGCSQRLYAATKTLQMHLEDRFGVLLWEDVFRQMHASPQFRLPGFDVDALQPYTEDARMDCYDWERRKA